ncbi:MAG: HD domain-containing protein [Thermoplasmatales archaeon]|nr:MAG: HD domain-containing protein [Thermoplasmatales archaeon]
MADMYHYEKKREQTMIETNSGKRKKEQFIENLREGDAVNDFFAVKIKNPLRSYKRGTWFSFIASDKTGEISVKFWGGENKDRVKRLHDSFSVGDIVQIRSGNLELYDEKPQISINETVGGIRRCSPSEYDVSDFIPALDEDKIKELYETIKKYVKEIENEQLANLLALFFDDSDFVKMYMHSPSAISHHHNYVGGNLEHAIGVTRLCKNICEMYSGINKDLLICGAILHDIGKLKEYEYAAAIEKTDDGNFIGHIVIGDRWVREKIDKLRKDGDKFSKELETQLSHLILSHHGKYEFGSPRMPKIIEACVLHYADLMDSHVKNYIQRVEDAKKATEDKWVFIYDSDEGKKRSFFLGEY